MGYHEEFKKFVTEAHDAVENPKRHPELPPELLAEKKPEQTESALPRPQKKEPLLDHRRAWEQAHDQ